jgi:mannose-1-phosphate guanylyltransferase
MPVLGGPLIWHTLDRLHRLGFSKVFMTLFSKAETVLELGLTREFSGMDVQFILEPELLGTGGGLRNAASIINPEEDLLVLPSDSLWDFDPVPAIQEHARKESLLTFVLMQRPDWDKYTALRTDPSGRLLRLGPLVDLAPPGQELSGPFTFTGIWIWSPETLSLLPGTKVFDIMTDFVVPQMRAGLHMDSAVVDGFWRDMGEPRRYIYGCLDYAEYLQAVRPGYIAGSRSSVSPDAVVRNCVLWDGVSVEAGAVLEESIVAAGVNIRRGAAIVQAMVLPQDVELPPEAGEHGWHLGGALVYPY